jgi:putative ABC transport system permease protein
MNWFSSLRFKLGALVGLRRIEDEIADEIRSHLDLATEANIARGLSPTEARAAAERECGQPIRAVERYRDVRGISAVSGWRTDWRDACRSLRRAPGFAIVVVLTLALGIGSAAAIFSLVDWALFRANDFPRDAVVVGGLSREGEFNGGRRETMIKAYREQAQSLTDYAFAHPYDVNVAVDGEVVTHGASVVTPNALPLLGIVPVLGRGFTAAEAKGVSPTVAIISDYAWRHYFHGAPDVLGKTLVVDGNRLCTVIGVLARGQQLPQDLPSDVLLPYDVPPGANAPSAWHLVWARLKPGVTAAEADADLARIWAPLPYEYAAYHPFNTPHVVPLTQWTSGTDQRMYWVLVAAVGFLYAIACLNATNLVVGRLLTRRRELSIRLALGGGHWRIVRLVALEVGVLTVMAGSAGCLLANTLGPLLFRVLASPPTIHAPDSLLDTRTLVVLIGVTVVSAIATLSVPVFRILRNDLIPGLRDGGVSLGDGPWMGRLRRVMIVSQAAATVVLLTGAGLMAETLEHLQRVRFGFDPDRLIKMQLAFPPDELPTGVPGLKRLDGVRECLARVPGVASVSYGSDSIASGHYSPGIKAVAPGTPIVALETTTLSVEFLQTTGMHLLRGSMYRSDGFGVLLNETLARRMFGDRDPIGQIIHAIDGADVRWPWTVVGILGFRK